MNERIRMLREQSLKTRPFITSERADLVTDFYKSGVADTVSTPVARALAFKHILLNKKISIGEGELFVGDRGPSVKATPTFPEICNHSLQDLEILHSRPKVAYRVDDHTRKLAKEKWIPFWTGRSLRDRILNALDADWKDAYSAGVFTEFMEQRAPGHTVLDGKIYSAGMHDFIHEIEERIARIDFLSDDKAFDRREELRAMQISAEALNLFALRYVIEAQREVKATEDPARKEELRQIAENCLIVPGNAPQTFYQALQYYWFVHLGVITELNTWDSFNPGRLDQHLFPFYVQGLKDGTLTQERARELLQAFWIKFNNQPAPPKVGITAQESNTYTDFCLINVGGVKSDGTDASNELTFLILDVIEEMRLLQPSSMVQISKKNPDRLVDRALKIISSGFGQPSLFNTDAIVQELVRQGKTVEDARNGGASGCVEAGAFGKEAYILTGYFNLPKVLELALNNGVDVRSGKQLGPKTGDPTNWQHFDECFDAFKTQLNHFIDIKIRGNRIIERHWATYLPAPFLSILIDDCIKQGIDYNAGGARYNTSYIQGVGIGSITDSLAALKTLVFEQRRFTMTELLEALDHDFVGFENIHSLVTNESPKYGNDDDSADTLMRRVFEEFYRSVDGRPNTRGGEHHIDMLPTTCHVYFGSVTGAMPDGRRCGRPLSEGISPVQGMDRNGPTAVLQSAAKMDHIRTGGTLLNQKFSPSFLATSQGISKVRSLIRTYFKMDGHHIQFNVVTAETLRKAQADPERYTDLIVRVAGYSDYFVDLTPELQEEIIGRTEQVSF